MLPLHSSISGCNLQNTSTFCPELQAKHSAVLARQQLSTPAFYEMLEIYFKANLSVTANTQIIEYCLQIIEYYLLLLHIPG